MIRFIVRLIAVLMIICALALGALGGAIGAASYEARWAFAILLFAGLALSGAARLLSERALSWILTAAALALAAVMVADTYFQEQQRAAWPYWLECRFSAPRNAYTPQEMERRLSACDKYIALTGDKQHYRTVWLIYLGRYPQAVAECPAYSKAYSGHYGEEDILYFCGVAKIRAGDVEGGQRDIEKAKQICRKLGTTDVEELYRSYGFAL